MLNRKWALLILAVFVGSMLLSACKGEEKIVEVTRVVTEEKTVVETVIEKETVVQTVVETVVEKETVVETLVKVVETPPEPESTVDRKGAWLDMVVVVEEPSAEAAVTRLNAGEIDVYAFTVADPELFQTVKEMDNLAYSQAVGSFRALTFNVVGPVFESTGKLNPFAVPRIREAMNWLVDRDYVVQEIMGGLGVPKFFPISGVFSDYARMVSVARKLEARYAYNVEKANEVITQEMEALGAQLVDGKWQYEGEPVELIFLIRTEDERREIGDYVANQLESIGFTVDRQYKTSKEASPLWSSGDPADGLWHMYTGGWVTSSISRDQGGNFDYYYTPRGRTRPLWQAYTPAPEYDAVADRLNRNDFATMEERAELFAEALELSLEDSAEVWIFDKFSFTPRLADVQVTADLAGAVAGAGLWPHTLRWAGEVGGAMTFAMPSILTGPWNPVAGSNWVYDNALVRATGDDAILPDPYTGLNLPQRLDSAEVYVREGLPVSKSLDWLTLDFVPSIEVPADAWIDWDAETQTFISVGEVYPDGLTAVAKYVCNYESTLFETQWHDGSNFDLSDMVLRMIWRFDPAKEASAVYDEAIVPNFESFVASFKGWRIAQQDPLVIEYYTDQYGLDAENGVTDFRCAYPEYAQGDSAWHMLAIGLLAEETGELAFSADKADALEVEWMNYVSGPSLEILNNYLLQAADDNYIPYAPTLSQYVSEQEAQARWANYQDWNRRKGHFWIGTGPFYLERGFPVEGTVILKHFPDFPDPADKWAGYTAPKIAEVELDGPGRVNVGEAATYNVYVTFEGAPYALADIVEVKYLVFDATGELAFTGQAVAVEDGLYQIELGADQTAGLQVGANKLEVAVVPSVVSIPSFEAFDFVVVAP